jgi:SIR2-like domain
VRGTVSAVPSVAGLFAPLDERGFFDELGAAWTEIVPVVGAGVALGAGAPSGSELTQGLVQAGGSGWAERHAGINRGDLFAVADALAGEFSESWVQEQVARVISGRGVTATPVLMALAKTASGLIVTTNYDSSVEVSASAAGIEAMTLTVADFDLALVKGDDRLRVLHLHGVAEHPETVVLTTQSYSEIGQDERAMLVMRDLSLTYRLLFLGHSLASKEAHLRRDILWAARMVPPARRPRKHLLITSAPDLDDPMLAGWAENVTTSSSVQVVAFADPDREFEATVRAAHVIAGPSSLENAELAPRMSRGADRHYLALPVAGASDVADPASRADYLAQTWQEGQTYAFDLDELQLRLLLVAGGGYGKTEELRQIGLRSSRHALFQPMTAFQPRSSWTDAGAAFVRGMRTATAARNGDVPMLTRERLRDEAYLFLLDGLDEVPAENREDILRLLNETVAAYPQHRWVLSSRPLPELSALAGFTAWTMLPDAAWLDDYAAHRAVPSGDLNEVLAAAPGVAEFVQIPIFAAAVIDHVQRGAPLPSKAIELIWQLADQHASSDTRIEPDPGQVRTWLDRVALLLGLAGTTEISVNRLQRATLHRDLPEVAPSGELITELAVRALITDTQGIVRFPANVIREARSARALIGAGEAGLDLLRSHILVDLGAYDAAGKSLRGVRPSWVSTLELALPAAPGRWWEEIREFDPMLAARATPQNATAAERHAAAWTIWNTYKQRRVWLDRGLTSPERGDFTALIGLIYADPPVELVGELMDGVRDDEPTIRANSLIVLSKLGDTASVLPLVANAIRDADPVVRRQAASCALDLNAADLAEPLASQAAEDPDDLAAGTLMDTAVVLAASQDLAIQIALAAPAGIAERALTALTHRIQRLDLIKLLRAQEPLDPALFDVILSGAIMRDTRDSWTPAEVAAIAHVAADHPEEMHSLTDLERVLSLHPLAAMAARLCHPPDSWLNYDLARLFATLDITDLARAIAILAGPADRILEAAGLEPDIVVLPETLEQAQQYAASVMPAREENAKVTHGTPRRNAQARAAQAVAAALAAGDWNTALEYPPPAQPETPVSGDMTLREHVTARLRRLIENETLAGLPDPRTGEVTVADLRTLEWAAWLGLPIQPGDLPQVAGFALNWDDRRLRQWVRRQWHPSAWPALQNIIRSLPVSRKADAASQVIPSPWPAELTALVLESTSSPELTDAQKLAAAEIAHEYAGPDVIREWAADPAPRWLLPLLIKIGDCTAEQRLLREVALDPADLPEWPLQQSAAWLSHVRCPESVSAVAAAARSAMIAGRQANDIDPIFRALDRCAGIQAPANYDTLIADPEIPHGAFLYYQRQTALNALLESHVPSASLDDPQLETLIINASTPPSTT